MSQEAIQWNAAMVAVIAMAVSLYCVVRAHIAMREDRDRRRRRR